MTALALATDVPDVFAYEAPFLVEKLLKERICATADEARGLFREVVRYLVLARGDRDVAWSMYSRRVDEAWHQLVLFTREYGDFCARYFGGFVPHNPGNAPEYPSDHHHDAPPLRESTRAGFAARYAEAYGEPLPVEWFDERNVSPDRRVINPQAGALTLRDAGELVELVDDRGALVVALSALAAPALAFLAATGAFYVRELPGGLTAGEQCAIVAVLVEHDVLRVAP